MRSVCCARENSGILYGPKTAPVALELNKKEFSSRVAGLEGSHLVRLKSVGDDSRRQSRAG